MGTSPGALVAVVDGQGRASFVRVDGGGSAQLIEGLQPIGRGSSRALRPWRELVPAEPTGVRHIDNVLVTPDGAAYAYSYVQGTSELHLVEGLR